MYDTEETLGSWCDSDRDAGIALQTRVLASTTHGNSLETLLTVLQSSPRPAAATSGHPRIPCPRILAIGCAKTPFYDITTELSIRYDLRVGYVTHSVLMTH